MSFDHGMSHVKRADRAAVPTQSFRTGLTAIVCFLTLGLLSGCGGGEVSVPSGTVSGKVTVQGKPLTQGQINFTSSTTGTGVYTDLGAEGTYELPNEIPAGEYRVYFAAPSLGDAPPSETGNPELRDGLKEVSKKYQSEQSTDLKADVKEGANTFDFDLKP